MSETLPWPQAIPFRKLQKSLSLMVETLRLDERADFKLKKGKTRIPLQSLPLRLSLGSKQYRLELHPETALDHKSRIIRSGKVLLRVPDFGDDRLHREARLSPGQSLVLGITDDGCLLLPGSNVDDYSPLISLKCFGDELLLQNHSDDTRVKVKALSPDRIARLVKRRVAILQRLQRMIQAPIGVSDPATALVLLQNVNQLLEKEAHRPTDRRGMPGGLVSLPERLTPALIGNLHAKVDNLLCILSRGGILHGLQEGWACLVFLGDAIHPQTDGTGDPLPQALAMLDFLMRLKLRFPEQIFYLRGRHDSFSPQLYEAEVPEGLAWRHAVKEARGKKYRKELERFYGMLPYLAASPRFIACPAGIPTGKLDREMLVDIRQYVDLEQSLTQSEQQNSRQKRYGKNDLKRLRKALQLPGDTPVIIGHSPFGGTQSVNMNLAELDNHHQVFSAGKQQIGAMTVLQDGVQPLSYPTEPLTNLYNSFFS